MIYLFSYDCGLAAYPLAQNKNNNIRRYWHYFYKDGFVYEANTQMNPNTYSLYKIHSDIHIDYCNKIEEFEYELPSMLHTEDFFNHDSGTENNNLIFSKKIHKHVFRIISESI